MRRYLAALAATGLLAAATTACGGAKHATPSATATFSGTQQAAAVAQVVGVPWTPTTASGPTLRPRSCTVRTSSGRGGYAIPDRGCTPGIWTFDVTNATAKSTTCSATFVARRQPNATALRKASAEVLAAYGLAAKAAQYEVQFLIPLRLGGAFDVRNLWPVQKGSSTAGDKTTVDQTLARAICANRGGVAAAQFFLAKDWTTALQEMGLH